MNYDKIWSLFNSLNISQRAMARIAKMSPTGFNSMMKEKTMRVATLEVIAKYFNKPMSYFFDNELYTLPATNLNEDGEYCQNCEKQKQLLNDLKEELRITQSKYIDALERMQQR